MNLIATPRTLAERIVNALTSDIYGRSGGDWFFDGIDEDVKREMTSDLVAIVQRLIDEELDKP